MAGVQDAQKLDAAASLKEARALVDIPAVSYGRIFAENYGEGPAVAEAWEEMLQCYGEGQATSLRAMCWFLHWGAYVGNTLNGIVGRKPLASSATLLFKAFMSIYYGSLYIFVVTPVGYLIRFLPLVPAWFSTVFNLVLISVASIWI
eukprot:CAMPEP_0197692442 /NCGR_PEP_ID=MMETSP1338-20131121/111086_1 /TAXON_ID=43686 ORGANISM="Pelagodinium beii, Strain RCC1491" /NCGR_SAMPLE_ID=MMETSP1338 /ASSEMBLY_ACC=CAM_ASM_000754 /LENGTH=146 /DNA_ID=CAMNT_0043275101 /DNA_START=229 /DNA_END=666 /DNA_ORIENTATION=-